MRCHLRGGDSISGVPAIAHKCDIRRGIFDYFYGRSFKACRIAWCAKRLKVAGTQMR